MTEPSASRLASFGSRALGRRAVLGGTFGLTLAAFGSTPTRADDVPLGVPPSGSLSFDVFRKDSRIGTHRLTFQRAGSAMTVLIAADFRVGLGPLTLFKYSLRTTEHWQDGKLVAATSQTDDNGDAASMSARLEGDALAVVGSKSGGYVAPPGAMLGTHWNRAELQGPMINPENGELMHFAVADRGAQKIDVGDKPVVAACYALAGPATIDLWYDSRSVWSALRAVAKDGSTIEYRLA